MRTLIVAALLVVSGAGPALAQCGNGGEIALFADNLAQFCNLVDAGPGQITVYVIHQQAPCGATGSRFRVRPPACSTGMTWLSDTSVFATIGNSQSGVTVYYGSGCRLVPGVVLVVKFMGLGLTSPCCQFPVENYQSPTLLPEAYDCQGHLVPMYTPFVSTINGGSLCPCSGAVPVQPATWGRVKALYTDQ